MVLKKSEKPSIQPKQRWLLESLESPFRSKGVVSGASKDSTVTPSKNGISRKHVKLNDQLELASRQQLLEQLQAVDSFSKKHIQLQEQLELAVHRNDRQCPPTAGKTDTSTSCDLGPLEGGPGDEESGFPSPSPVVQGPVSLPSHAAAARKEVADLDALSLSSTLFQGETNAGYTSKSSRKITAFLSLLEDRLDRSK